MKLVHLTKIAAPVHVRNGVPVQFTQYGGTEYNADVVPGARIRLWGTHQRTPFNNTFEIGDYATYYSFNYQFYGKITKITANSVTIQEKHCDKNHRLNMYEFAWRNCEFSAEKAHRDQMEHMD